jgi:chromosome partitioning protein
VIPRIISVCNLKGGAGKSTIAVNLACAIRAHTGIDCILVDADRQATALKWAENGALGVRVTSRVLHEAKPDDTHPGLMWVTQIRMLAERNPSVIIDMPPGLEYSLAAVAAISDLIFVPVNPSGVDFHSTKRFINLVQKTRQIRHSDKPRCVIVPNRLDRRTAIARKMSLYEQFGEPIAPPIGMRSTFVYAFDHGRWVGDLSPRSAAHKEIGQLVSFIAGGADLAGSGDGEVAAGIKAKRRSRRKAASAVTPAAVPAGEDAERPESASENSGGEEHGEPAAEDLPQLQARDEQDTGTAGPDGGGDAGDGETAGDGHDRERAEADGSDSGREPDGRDRQDGREADAPMRDADGEDPNAERSKHDEEAADGSGLALTNGAGDLSGRVAGAAALR